MNIKTNDPIAVYIGHAIRKWRVTAGISQTQLAEQIGVSFQQIQKYENGTNNVNPTRLMQICAALAVGVEAIFPPRDPDVALRDPTEGAIYNSREKLHFIQDYEKLDPEIRLALRKLVSQMAVKS